MRRSISFAALVAIVWMPASTSAQLQGDARPASSAVSGPDAAPSTPQQLADAGAGANVASTTAPASARVVVEQMPAPVDAVRLLGVPLNREFAELVGPAAHPLFDARRTRTIVARQATTSFHRVTMETARAIGAGLGPISLSVETLEAQRALVVTVSRISRIQTLDDSTMTRAAPSVAAYYVRRVYFGRALRLIVTARDSGTGGGLNFRANGGLGIGAWAQQHQSEIRVEHSAAGFEPVRVAIESLLDLEHGFRPVGPEQPILVDYAAVPGSDTSRSRSVEIQVDAVEVLGVGTLPWLREPRWVLRMTCALNQAPRREEIDLSPRPARGAYLDRQVRQGEVVPTTALNAAAAWRARVSPNDTVQCALDGRHDGGMWGSPSLRSASLSPLTWALNSLGAQTVELTADNGHIRANVTVSARDVTP